MGSTRKKNSGKRKGEKRRKLSKQEREIVYKKTELNAGLGWSRKGQNPIAYEEGWR